MHRANQTEKDESLRTKLSTFVLFSTFSARASKTSIYDRTVHAQSHCTAKKCVEENAYTPHAH